MQTPQVLWKNKIAEILDEMRYNYSKLMRKGYTYGLIAIDQDAKLIAIDTKFDRKLNYWDLSSIGAALYGVARQGQDFFDANELERASLIYNDLQIFVKSIGKVQITPEKKREILIIILTDKDVNIGLIILQMNQYANKIRSEIENNSYIKKTLSMNETELKEYIRNVKDTLFGKELGSIL